MCERQGAYFAQCVEEEAQKQEATFNEKPITSIRNTCMAPDLREQIKWAAVNGSTAAELCDCCCLQSPMEVEGLSTYRCVEVYKDAWDANLTMYSELATLLLKRSGEVEATVKWFNPEKGFGFVELGDGSGDAFLHVSVLQRAGSEAVNPAATMRVRVGPGQKGQQVTEVVEITSPGEPGGGGGPGGGGDRPPRREFGGGDRGGDRGGFGGPRPPRAGGGGGFVPSGPAEEMRGTVKWYSAEKGFGFVSPEGGGRDVFVHATALERSSLPPLTEGQSVVMQVVQGKKGPEASTLTRA
jgi:CspA family cold shock protein